MSANQSIKPITLEEKEHLYIGGCDTVELAKKYGTHYMSLMKRHCAEFVKTTKKLLKITLISR